MKNYVFSHGCCIRSKFPCFLKEISIYSFFYYHVDYFFQLIGASETLHILVQCSTYVCADISGTSCGALSLSSRELILFFCCWLSWWRVRGWMLPSESSTNFLVVFKRNTPIIFFSHSHWFRNWNWLIPLCRSDYAWAIPDVTLTRAVPSRWSSVRDDDPRWNHLQVLTYNNIGYHNKYVWGEKLLAINEHKRSCFKGDDDRRHLIPSST